LAYCMRMIPEVANYVTSNAPSERNKNSHFCIPLNQLTKNVTIVCHFFGKFSSKRILCIEKNLIYARKKLNHTNICALLAHFYMIFARV